MKILLRVIETGEEFIYDPDEDESLMDINRPLKLLTYIPVLKGTPSFEEPLMTFEDAPENTEHK